MNIALVYDWIHTFGGAERILLALHELFPKAPLFTAVYSKKDTPWASRLIITPSFLQKIPFAKSHHELFPLLTPIAFETFDFSKFNLVISITSSDAKGIVTKPTTLHICYMLTPTRYLWSHYSFYFRNKLLKLMTKPAVYYLRKWDLVAKKRPDFLLAISKTVQLRIRKYYGCESEVVYPPVETDRFIKQPKKGTFLLIVSRLIPYKRLELPILACNDLKIPLVIIGEGRSRHYLKRIAGPSVRFVGNLTDRELIRYYQNCRAVIISGEEDFGIVSVEAQASGKPVIAFAFGGSKETVIEDKTGLLFYEQTVSCVKNALKRFENISFSPEACVDNSQKFSTEIFKREFLKKINLYSKYYFNRKSKEESLLL